MVSFVRKDSQLRRSAARPLLAAQFFHASLFGSLLLTFLVFDFLEQHFPGSKAVQALLPRLLALNLDAGGPMIEHDARRSLVHILSAVTCRPHERLLDVIFPDACGQHSLLEPCHFFRADKERVHGRKLR